MASGFASSDIEVRIEAVCAMLVSRRFLPAALVRGRDTGGFKEQSVEFLFCLDNQQEIERRLANVGFALSLSPDRDFFEAVPNPDVEEAVSLGTRLTMIEGKLLVGLAILHERKIADKGRFGTIESDMRELLSLLVSEYHAFDKEPPARDLQSAMRRFERCALVVKRTGSWADADAEFTIQPSIARVASPEAIAAYEERYGNAVVSDEETYSAVMERIEENG